MLERIKGFQQFCKLHIYFYYHRASRAHYFVRVKTRFNVFVLINWLLQFSIKLNGLC